MLDKNVTDVPEDEGHGAPGLRGPVLSIVPCVAVPVDASCTVAVDADPLAAEDEPGGMVLEGNVVRVVAPVVQVV